MKQVLHIDGMSCNHCAMSVKNSLEKVAGVASVEVDLKQSIAEVESRSAVSEVQLSSAVESAGYKLASIR